MTIWDEDNAIDEMVGTMEFGIEKYVRMAQRGESFEFFWEDIYGAPTGYSGKNTDLMNENPAVASAWKGRVLMQVTAEETDEP